MVICEKGPYLAVVADQIAYTQSVRDFVRDLMKRFIPGRWANCVIPDGNDRFTERLDAAFLKVDEATATRGDYCNEVVEVLCAELRSVCATLREVCETRGHREYAERYLSRERFVNMLLDRDARGAARRARGRIAGQPRPDAQDRRDTGREGRLRAG